MGTARGQPGQCPIGRLAFIGVLVHSDIILVIETTFANRLLFCEGEIALRNVTLGRTNAQVSEICFGTMFFGTTVPVADSERLLDRYLAAGGIFLDTAKNYCTRGKPGVGGESETLLGDWKEAPGKRHSEFLA